ncbi:MAG: hypothetical protein DWQ30_10150 [Acidobacteria bacterium]|nr:MAG: hypothetical protein DWQ30_10150 [Acidobacteriota bacterium]
MRSAVAVARGAEQAVGGPEGSGDRGQGIGVRGWGSGVWGQGLGVRGQGFGARPRTRGAKGAEQVAGVWRRRMYGDVWTCLAKDRLAVGRLSNHISGRGPWNGFCRRRKGRLVPLTPNPQPPTPSAQPPPPVRLASSGYSSG